MGTIKKIKLLVTDFIRMIIDYLIKEKLISSGFSSLYEHKYY